MKSIIYSLLLTAIAMCGSCSESDRRVAQGHPYTMTGRLWQGPDKQDSIVTLIIDRHHSSYTATGDTLPTYQQITLPVVEGNFSYQGETPYDADELYLYDQHGNTARMYGTNGTDLQVEIDSTGAAHIVANDTTAIRRTITLRDSIPFIQDSLLVRRRLGSIPESAKPEWLMHSINDLLDQKWMQLSKRNRLPRIALTLADTTFRIPNNNPESLVMLFWSDDVPASIDSLQIFKAIARDYGLYEYADNFANERSATRSRRTHRIDMLSLCVHTADSAQWRKQVKGLPGKHLVLPGGLAHPLATACQVHQLPYIMIVDRFGNYLAHDVWNQSLYLILEKTPMNSDLNRRLKLIK